MDVTIQTTPLNPLQLTPKLITSSTNLRTLIQLHAHLIKLPPQTPNSTKLHLQLISTYGKLNDLDSSIKAFAHSPIRNNPDAAFLYNSLLQSYIFNSNYSSCPDVYFQMLCSDVQPNKYTFPLLFKACSLMSSEHALVSGAQLHGHAIKFGHGTNPFVGVGVMDMYMKNGEVGDAWKMFDGMSERDEVAWNALITGYVQNGRAMEALWAFERMRREGVSVGCVAVSSVVGACAHLGILNLGKSIHALVVKSGFISETVISTALLDMYANCSAFGLAKQVFQEMHDKDLISWNCLISYCAQYGLMEDAFQLFVDMQKSGLKPNGSSLAGILPAVACSNTLHLSKCCHCFILRNHFESDEFVLTALMDAYAKSGDLVIAHKLFDRMPKKGVVAWTSIISGYGIHGSGKKALVLFEKMLEGNIKPNHVTYVGVLSTCVHSGLVDEGKAYFKMMAREHGITPSAQHFTCMVDLLSRAGLFNETMDLINEMPIKPTPGIWGALLGGCKIHRNVKLGKYAADRLFELDSSDPGFYVLLSNIYASAGMWEEVKSIRNLMRERNMKKIPGWSSIEIGSRLFYFVSGDTSQKDSCEIYRKLEELFEKIKKVGYVPETKAALHNVNDDAKENVLKGHSEKLAMVYGLLRTSNGSPIRIMKNLRTCVDCHAFAKYVSKEVSRVIILRDTARFHYIQDGNCSCGDYW